MKWTSLDSLSDNATLDELLAQIKVELVKLGPLIDLDAIREMLKAAD